MSPSPFWSPRVHGLVPYVPGEQPRLANLVKLNTNENPYPPSPRVAAAIQAAVQQGLQLYPDPDSTLLRQAVAAHHGLAADQVFVGNGSDEVLAHAFFAFFQQRGAPLLLPDVTYSFYQVYCGLYGIPMEVVPLADGLRVDVEALVAPAGVEVAGVVIANPNAPTGIGLPLASIERLLQMHPGRVVLVDEAYVDFGGENAVGLVAQYPNLLVVHTLSKSRALAGLRVGVAFGQSPLIDALERVKNSFNSYPLDRLAQAGATAAYEDRAYFDEKRAAVMHSREGLSLQLEDLGFEVLPSQANFVFARHPSHDAAGLAARLRERGVLVRHFRQPRIAQYLRISIGTPQQCDALLQALSEILR
ncbi:histidinol-phosphate transaminase [Rhodoferax koreense]|uniref:Histidinol-phosphate aminotransferase n=1 Tax=Rhodoferax koreensis TaxID=1842727 RepID=A0A1P8K3N8_9BURK|nr:histidinol-phosphate transaminase [Rhodoferax koreense]